MARANRFRDSTEILLPATVLEDVRKELQERFTVTVRREGARIRVIGSPVEIKAASDFLAMNGVNMA